MAKLVLARPASKPMVFHVHCFEFLHDIVVDHAEGGGVVGLHRSGWLRMAEVFQCVAQWDGFTTVYVKSSDFCLCRR